MHNLGSLISGHAQRTPKAPALIYGKKVYSYVEFEERCRTVASNLVGLGIGQGDRVAIWLPNVPAWLELFVACTKIGAVAVAVNTRFRSSEVGDLLKRSGAKLLVFWPAFKGINFTNILREIDTGFLTTLKTVISYGEGTETQVESVNGLPSYNYETLLHHKKRVRDRAGMQSSCIIFTTSGTTKTPKLVLHGQKGVSQHVSEVALHLSFDQPESALLQVIPFCGVFGFSQALAALAGGAGIVCVPEFSVDETLELIDKHKITHICGSDEMFMRLLNARPKLNPFPTIKFFGYANFTPSLHDAVARADRQGVKLVGLYGSSELLAFFAAQRSNGAVNSRTRMGGFLTSKLARVRVRDPNSDRLLAEGEIGELEFKSPSMMRRYVNNKEATSAVITSDGFFRSGDLGRLCADGSFEFLSRMGDVLRLGGFLVNPQEIENYIQQHADVVGSQVIGVDGIRGTRPVAFVIMEETATTLELDLIRHCQEGMAKFKIPARIFRIDQFPTTTGANGTKIQRKKLIDMAIERLDAAKDI